MSEAFISMARRSGVYSKGKLHPKIAGVLNHPGTKITIEQLFLLILLCEASDSIRYSFLYITVDRLMYLKQILAFFTEEDKRPVDAVLKKLLDDLGVEYSYSESWDLEDDKFFTIYWNKWVKEE